MAGSTRPTSALLRGSSIHDEDLGVFGPFPWKVGDAFQGTQIFGGTGSGKTTGSGAALACAMLRAGFGGLVLTAKADDASRWKSYARVCGRADDVVEITPHNGAAFNILDYEYVRGGKLTHNIVSLLMGAMTSGAESSSSEPYWNEALRELLIHAIDLCVLAAEGQRAMPDSESGGDPGPLQLSQIDRIIRTAPQTAEQVGSRIWRRTSACWKAICVADAASNAKVFSAGRRRDLDATTEYWLHDFPKLSSRTRSIIVSTFTAKVAGLLRSPLREMFFETTDPASSPEVSMRAVRNERFGKIIIVNVPVKTYGEIGRLAQILYKLVWTRTADRRSGLFGYAPQGDDEPHIRPDPSLKSPVFLWADESQYFITAEDMLFQQTARASRVATVYLTQNIGNYKAVLGKGHDAPVYSLLGNLQTKIFHTNGDPATNKFAEETFGKEWTTLQSKSVSAGDSMQDGRVSLNSSRNTSNALHHIDVVSARDLTLLAFGGKRYGYRIQALVFQAGRNWQTSSTPDSNTTNVFHHVFEQFID